MDQHQEEAHRETAASPSDLQLGSKKGLVHRQGMKRDVCDGSTWQRAEGNTEKHTETLLEDGTRECIVLRVKKVSLGSKRCCRLSCMTSHATLLVCLIVTFPWY